VLIYLENEQKEKVGVGYPLKLLEEILWQESDDAVLGSRYIVVLHHAAPCTVSNGVVAGAGGSSLP